MVFRLVFLVFVFSFHANSQSGYGFYYTNFGTDGDDVASRVIQSKSGHYFVLGSTTESSFGQTDFFLVKHDSIHQYQWQKAFGGFFADIGKDIVELKDSGFVLAGYTNSFGAGGYDGLFYRIDNYGNVVWFKTVGSQDWDFINKIQLVGDTMIVACGYKEDKNKKKEGWLLCLDLNGNVKWEKLIGGLENDELNSLTLTQNNQLVFIGTSCSYGDLNGDIWIPVYSLTGDSITTKFFGGIKKEIGMSIYQETNKDIVFCGGSESYSNGKSDAFMIRTDSNFVQVWQMFYGQSGFDEVAWDIKPTKSTYGSMLVCYSTKESVAFGLDAKAVLLNPSGYYIDGGRIGSYGEDEVYSIVACRDKGFVLAGYTTSYDAKMKDFYLLQFDSLVHGTGTIVLGSPELNKNATIELYPMPFKDELKVIAPKEGIADVKLYSIEGKQLPIQFNRENNVLINNLTPGLYIIAIYTGQSVFYHKIIRE